MNYDLTLEITLRGNWATAKKSPEAREQALEDIAASVRGLVDDEITRAWWLSPFSVTESKVEYTARPRK